ncbi:MAG: DNA methyltransferase, partial [Bacteroidota bacterium]
MLLPVEAVRSIHDQSSFLEFLRSHLGWPIQEQLSFEDLSYGWQPEEIGLKPDNLKGSTIVQLRPFTENQPWGIFILQLAQLQVYVTQLRALIRALNPMKRKLKDYPTWQPKNVLLICTPDWKNYTFAHFEGTDPNKAKLSMFGWDYQSDFVRTLCEFNIPKLEYPQAMDLLGLDPSVWLQQWASAFDVKRVTDKFYEEYDSIFRSMKKILSKHFGVSLKLYDKKPDDWTAKDEKADRPVHLFVQNLVNRLMFLKFLEKRRWLDLNPNYLANLYKKAIVENKNFYEEYLFYVFFAGLNRQVPAIIVLDGEKIAYQGQSFQERIGILPFLNGGLFEKEPIDEKIKIPNEAFTELFDLFSRYNFTVNEDTPLDVEVAVNPEMLGKVFEESVIARKEKGAYYTPREIVSFMCCEALKNHLVQQTTINDVVVKVGKLIDEHSANLLESHDALELYKSLANIKVLDPAVGSGAFPVGMMFEILQCYRIIGAKLEKDHPFLVQNKLANPHDVYLIKKQIIQNNLYGVDIEEFAVNIARLRFWLSLAVDFPIEFGTREEFIADVHKIESLPNLLYKIKQGDSLLAKYHDVSLEPHGRLSGGEFARGRKQRIVSAVDDITKLKM